MAVDLVEGSLRFAVKLELDDVIEAVGGHEEVDSSGGSAVFRLHFEPQQQYQHQEPVVDIYLLIHTHPVADGGEETLEAVHEALHISLPELIDEFTDKKRRVLAAGVEIVGEEIFEETGFDLFVGKTKSVDLCVRIEVLDGEVSCLEE